MRNIFRLLTALLILTACLNCTMLLAQDVEKLPDDPRVRRGSLANGLSYILIKNTAQKGYAHFGVAQRVGSTLEEDGETGMFKMLEALTVKGTRNFTDSTIITYLKSIGVKPDGVSFTTREDDVTYLIKDVPASNQNTIDSSLLILYNWLNSINIDEEDIKDEAPFVKNALVYEWDATRRLDDKLLNALYPQSNYATNLKPEHLSGIDDFSSKELRNFYYKWFRPDFQSVIVVGDIDLNLIETKVKSVFSTIQKPLDKQSRSYFTPEPFDGVKVYILKDKEYNRTKISIDILKEPLVKKYKNTSVPFIQEYMDHAISKLLFARLRDGIINNTLPITNLQIKKGKFMNIRNQESFSITFETLPNMIYSAISFVNAEIGKMAKYGFNGQECARSKEIYFRELEQIYDNRAALGNDIYLQRALDYFYNDGTLASIELKFEIMKEILFTISLNQLNQYAGAMLGQSDNVVISCRMPEYEGMEGITPERILAAYTNAGLRTPSIRKEAPIVKWPEFAEKGAEATVVSSVSDVVTNADIFILSNGATVVLKRNASDTVSFRAVSKGGYSLVKGANYGFEQYLNDVLNMGGLENMSQPELERLYAYHNLDMKAAIRQNTEVLEGYAQKNNVEKLFHAIHMNMTGRRADQAAFDLYKQGKLFESSYRDLAPSVVFKDSILHYNYSNKNYIRRMDNEEIAGMDYASMLNSTRERFANAADFVFIFVGDIDVEAYRELVLKYIGSIKGNPAAKEEWMTVPNYLTKGRVERRFLYRMINPRTFTNLTYSCGMDYNLSNNIMGRLLDEYVEGILAQRSSRRYMMCHGVKSSLLNYPEQIFAMGVEFETDSANADVVKGIVGGAIKAVAAGAVQESGLAALKQQLKDDFLAANATNRYWLDVFEHRYMMGKDFFSNYMQSLDAITPGQLKDFASKLLNEGNMVAITMEGTTKDVSTENLFKENEFIKEYFDISW